jgi:erythronate-4-phosphate dehydrogenase
VRSVTKVNRQLLDESAIRFVGSATIGTDHVDLSYLQQQGIVFINAPGCNATSAAEYVVSAVLHFSQRQQIQLAGLKVGVVGYGNVGSRVTNKLAALGCELLVYDPPREQQFHDRVYVSWEQIQDADIVTAHVPLTKTGDYPTYQMFNAGFFSSLKDNALFINTSRGAAVDETALKQIKVTGKSLHLILDVWQHEPNIDMELLQQTVIATPHIAGYSAEGKHRGLEMVYQAACQYLKVQPQWSLEDALTTYSSLIEPDLTQDDVSLIRSLVQMAYAIEQDDASMRKLPTMTAEQRGAWFDNLRKNYPVRREFPYYRVLIPPQRDSLSSCLSQLGFSVIRETGP